MHFTYADLNVSNIYSYKSYVTFW